MFSLSIPLLNAIGGGGIGVGVLAGIALLVIGMAALGDVFDRGQGKAAVLASIGCALLLIAGIGVGVWAFSTASLRTDVNVPGRLDRKQVDVNVNSDTPTGVIVGAG